MKTHLPAWRKTGGLGFPLTCLILYHKQPYQNLIKTFSPESREGVRVMKRSLNLFLELATCLVIRNDRRVIWSCHRGSYALRVKEGVAEGTRLLTITRRYPFSLYQRMGRALTPREHPGNFSWIAELCRPSPLGGGPVEKWDNIALSALFRLATKKWRPVHRPLAPLSYSEKTSLKPLLA